MGKAFDTVDRGTLFKDLTEILEEDELHMISILLKYITLQVKIGNNTGRAFTTTVGVLQGDCLSPVLHNISCKSPERRNHRSHICKTNHLWWNDNTSYDWPHILTSIKRATRAYRWSICWWYRMDFYFKIQDKQNKERDTKKSLKREIYKYMEKKQKSMI